MSNTDIPPAIAPLSTLQASVRTITETLASELGHPGDAAPAWSEQQWLLARAVAAIHGVSPLLARSLRWQGPPGWQEFLDEQRMHTESRHVRIRALLDQLNEAGRGTGIALMALKGAALHELQLYTAGERPMADVDLLVREEDTPRAGRMLEALGFHLTHTNWKHQVFAADAPVPGGLGENSANGLKIELHSQIQEVLPQRAVDISTCLLSNTAGPGLNQYPSRAALMLHLLLHAAGAMAFRSVRLINLNDISRLSVSMSSDDWDELLAQERTLDQPLWWSYPPLALTAQYYDSIPKRVVTHVASRCQWSLKQICRRRTLSDVSLSHLWVTAFPGIEWARSPGEMLAYVRGRILPDAQVRSLRKVLAIQEPAAAHSTWAHMSQGRRLLRWLTSRPARPESLHPIQLALAQPPLNPSARAGH